MLPLHGLLFSITIKGSFISTNPQINLIKIKINHNVIFNIFCGSLFISLLLEVVLLLLLLLFFFSSSSSSSSSSSYYYYYYYFMCKIRS